MPSRSTHEHDQSIPSPNLEPAWTPIKCRGFCAVPLRLPCLFRESGVQGERPET